MRQKQQLIAGSSRYYAVPIDRLVSLLEANSFIEIQRLDGVLYRPVLLARRGTGQHPQSAVGASRRS